MTISQIFQMAENAAAQIALTPTPDLWWWYSLSTVLAAALITIIWKYVNDTKKILLELMKIQGEMKTLIAMHDVEIKHLQEKYNLPSRPYKK